MAGYYDNTGYVPSGMEKGHAAWDIGQILTRHDVMCAKALDLKRTVGKGITPEQRADEANLTPCTCGRGTCPSERTRHAKRTESALPPAA